MVVRQIQDLELAESREGAVAEGADDVFVEVELGQSRTRREAVIRDRRQEVGAQTEHTEAGQDRSRAGGQHCDLVVAEVDFVDLCEDTERRPGQTGKLVSGEQQNLG